MISLIALFVLIVLLESGIMTMVLSYYTGMSVRDSWSLTWSSPAFPIGMAVVNLLVA